MNKKELSNALVEKIGLSITDAQRCVNGVVDIIAEEMRQGGRVTILGFGTFSVIKMQGNIVQLNLFE